MSISDTCNLLFYPNIFVHPNYVQRVGSIESIAADSTATDTIAVHQTATGTTTADSTASGTIAADTTAAGSAAHSTHADTNTTQASQTPYDVEVIAAPAVSTTTLLATSTKPLSKTKEDSEAQGLSSSNDTIGEDTVPLPVEWDLSTRSSIAATATPPATPTIDTTNPYSFASTATESVPSESLQSHSGSSDDTSGNASLRILLGSILGASAFVALVLLICFLLFRHRRRKQINDRGIGGRENLLRGGRESADSSAGLYHGYGSGVSNASGASASLYNFEPNTLVNSDHDGHHNPSQEHACHSNPFTDSAEITRAMQGSTPNVDSPVQNPFANPVDNNQISQQAHFPRRPASVPLFTNQSGNMQRPGMPFVLDERSIRSSDRSLGSTIILPGRSSSGSSLQQFSRHISAAELGLSSPNESVTRVSTRSDPFDLEVPARAMERHSFTILPRANV
ncbi:hypothetical protein EYZ11_012582 [Aspergillus tanneri]|uniref:Mid2 domain-containing protein n=1 Tax=Aspergillus tanneri TaxID=1220188 RepID=A0A4V3UMN4_9EURO|nr:hypothetical protein EYZ11_012582 [Aspergillus tanneri]